MNIYHPYDVLADTDECLHLKETESRESIHFLISRILPIFMLMFMWFLLQQVGASIPVGWIYVLIAGTLFVVALLLSRSYITEIKIMQGREIFIVVKTIFGTREKTIDVKNIKKVLLVRKSRKHGNVQIVVQTLSKKSYTLLNIPARYVDEHHLRLIKERIEDLLQIKVSDS